MINIFKTDDLEKYPQLNIAIMHLVEDWIGKNTKYALEKWDIIDVNRKVYRDLCKRSSLNKIADLLLEKQIKIYLSEMLLESIFIHLAKYGDPETYRELIEIAKSEKKIKIKKGFDLITLLSIYFNIAKNRINDSILKQNLKRSVSGQNELFIEAKKILDQKILQRLHFTKKNALTDANKIVKVYSEDAMKDKPFMNKLENRFKQFEQREAKKKIKKVNRIAKG